MIMLTFFSIFLIGNVSAFEFDNSLRYENNDMKVTIENVWGLPLFGSDLGSVELKSHKFVDEILRFGYGTEEVVMYYDFTNWEFYENGLGEVYFTDKRTGEIIEKDYYFVEWVLTTINRSNNNDVLVGYSENGTVIYEQNITWYSEEVWAWKKLENKDIPNRDVRIGLKTYVDKGDYIDAIWTIAGKKIEKHAGWVVSNNVDLVSYYKLDEQDTTGSGTIIDSVLINDGVNNGGDNVTGQILTAYDFVDATPDSISVSDSASLDITGSMTVNMWINSDASNGLIVSKSDLSLSDGWRIVLSGTNTIIWIVEQSDGADARGDSVTTVSVGVWTMITGVYRAGDRVEIFINGVSDDNDTVNIESAQLANNNDLFIADDVSSTIPYDGTIDEVFIASRDWSATEILDLYNAQKDGFVNGSFSALPTVTLNSPIDNFSTINNTIIFNGTVTSIIGVTNVSLFIDGILNETNSSGINDTDYLFTKVISNGDHNWTYESCNIDGCTTATTRTFVRFII